MAVIVLHYGDGAVGNGFKYVPTGSANYYILYFLGSLCTCAVDLFLIISAYYLSKTDKRKLSKVFELLLQVILINLFVYFFRIAFGTATFSISTLFRKLLPINYYVVIYCALYLISPYINQIFLKINNEKKSLNKLIIMFGICVSILPILVDILQEIIGKEIMGLSTVGAWGSQRGFTLINFMFVYMMGAYLRFSTSKNYAIIKNNSKKLLILLALNTIIIFVWTIICTYFTIIGKRSSWCYHNPFVILQAVLIFLIFKNIKISKKWINEVARAAFTCYLIHGLFLRKININKYVNSSPFIMLASILVSIIVIYSFSYVVYKVYSFCISPVLKKTSTLLDKIDVSF